jgi:hypothetical protein
LQPTTLKSIAPRGTESEYDLIDNIIMNAIMQMMIASEGFTHRFFEGERMFHVNAINVNTRRMPNITLIRM